MAYTKRNVMESDKDTLIQIVINLQSKLDKKNAEILRTRTKLRAVQNKMMKMKDTVRFQRNRILELYPAESSTGGTRIEIEKNLVTANKGA